MLSNCASKVAAAVDAVPDSPAIRGRRTLYINEAHVFGYAGVGRRNNRPRRPVPMLDQRLPFSAVDVVGTDSPAIRRRCACYIIEVVPLAGISIRRGNDRPCAAIPM